MQKPVDCAIVFTISWGIRQGKDFSQHLPMLVSKKAKHNFTQWRSYTRADPGLSPGN